MLEHPREECSFNAMRSLEEIALKKSTQKFLKYTKLFELH